MSWSMLKNIPTTSNVLILKNLPAYEQIRVITSWWWRQHSHGKWQKMAACKTEVRFQMSAYCAKPISETLYFPFLCFNFCSAFSLILFTKLACLFFLITLLWTKLGIWWILKSIKTKVSAPSQKPAVMCVWSLWGNRPVVITCCWVISSISPSLPSVFPSIEGRTEDFRGAAPLHLSFPRLALL